MFSVINNFVSIFNFSPSIYYFILILELFHFQLHPDGEKMGCVLFGMVTGEENIRNRSVIFSEDTLKIRVSKFQLLHIQ